MRRIVLAVLCAVALAGCGGGSTGTAAGGPSGAEVAPANALAFVAINTDRSSDQWKRGDSLLKKFPFRDDLVSSVNRALSEGVDFRGEVLPVLGDELDAVVVKTANGPEIVGLAQPTDEQRFDAALEKGTTPTLHKKVGEWTVFSESQAALNAVTGEGDALADEGAFTDAMDELPDEANAKAYVAGGKLADVLRARIPDKSQVPAGDVEWLSLALSSHDDGWKLDGAAKAKRSSAAQTFEPTLLDRVPTGALVVASFRGEEGLRRLRDTPGAQRGLAQLQQLLGVSVDQLSALVSDEGVFFVQKSLPVPEVTLVLKQKDTRRALATLDTLARRASTFLGARLETRGKIKKLTLGKVAIYYGVDRGAVAISDTSAAFGRVVSSAIDDDPVFKEAKSKADVPDELSALLYVNVKDSVPVFEGLAQLSGTPIPLEVSQNLAPLQSLIAYATTDDDVTKFSALLHVR